LEILYVLDVLVLCCSRVTYVDACVKFLLNFIFIVPCIVIFYEITSRCDNVQWNLFLCKVHSTCFGRYTRPSSGVQF